MKNYHHRKIWSWIAASIVLAQVLASKGGNPAVEVKPAQDFPASVQSDEAFLKPTVTDPSLVVIIFGRDVHERLRTVHSLGSDLSAAQVKILLDFVQAPPAASENNLPALCLLKNDILNLVQTQRIAPADLAETLIAVYRNLSQDEVLRDYALQHLVTWSAEYKDFSPKQLAAVRKALFEAAQGNKSMAGTALLGLHRLGILDARFEEKELRSLVERLVLSETTDSANRITAVQVWAEEGGSADVMPTVKSLAISATNVPLQAAAISALGKVGTVADIALLDRLKAKRSPSLEIAIASALKELRHRFSQQELARTNNER